MIFLIVFLPFLAFGFVSLFSRFIGRKGSCLVTFSSVLSSFILSCFVFYKYVLSNQIIYFNLLPWIKVGLLNINWGFYIDQVSGTMLIVITSISMLVHLYSIEYMSEDPHLPRFMSYLSLFTFFMLMLVTANNFMQMFFGWEGVGLASYLLINFWHTRIQANKSAMKAIIVNRVGDFGLIIAMGAIFELFHTLDYTVIFSLANSVTENTFSFLGYDINCLTLISVFLFVGCVGKSAQLGLHTWLPDAMEGPTPVSALIHAATMVTAGVFLIIRCSPIIEYSATALSLITIVGGVTAFFASTVALVQNDLKRVIAYSTCSQLGYMIFSCGLSSYNVAMFHLMNHAFFKALLFLSAGSVIHAMSDEQDMRKMGGLLNLLPLTYSVMIIGSLSLMGFPFLTGFYSKDLILEVSRFSFSYEGRFVYWLGTVSAFFTAFYSTRLIYLTFLNKTNMFKSYIKTIHEPLQYMTIPLLILSICSVFWGYVFRDMFVGMGSDFWGSSIFIRDTNVYSSIESEFLSSFIKMLPVILSIFASFLALYLYNNHKSILIFLKGNSVQVYTFLNKKWYFDIVYNNFIVNNFLKFGYNVSFRTLDRGLIEWFGPTGVVDYITKISSKLSNLQSGYIYHYMFLILLGLIFLMLNIFVNMEFYIKIFLVFALLSIAYNNKNEK